MPLNIHENVPLAPMTTLQVGGPARFFAEASSEEDVTEAFNYAKIRDIEVFVLGGGSNILVSDAGFNGLVLRIALRGIERNGETLTAAAGEDWDAFVDYCVENGLAGVECLSGIPGSVGGTPVQNVGAYGQEVSETIASVRCFDRTAGVFTELTNEQCGFEYRKSIFNSSERDRYVVLSVTYRLDRGGKAKIAYKELIEHFSGAEPTLTETREAILNIRRTKSMVIEPEDPNSRSAGSFFKNPVISNTMAADIAENLLIRDIPQFRVNEQEVKIPAAWLIENAGFSKGHVLGKAGISSNHSLAIINRGGATATEILELKDLIQNAVLERFGIQLQPEPIFIGF